MNRLSWLKLTLLPFLLVACEGPDFSPTPDSPPQQSSPPVTVPPTPQAPYSCIKLVNPSPTPTASPGLDAIRKVTQPLFAASERLWNRPDGRIPVCWEPETFRDGEAEDRKFVKEAIEGSWGVALNIPLTAASKTQVALHFDGWGKCADSDEESIRIAVRDVNSQTLYLGRTIAGKKSGLLLDFTFKKWNSEVCPTSEKQRRRCIKAVAVHEFGHALGFAHEQNREDTDRETCEDAPQGSKGDLMLGGWDLDSVMNYCNPVYNNLGVLSSGDIMGLQFAYYTGDFNRDCITKFVPETGREPSNQKAVKHGAARRQHERAKNR